MIALNDGLYMGAALLVAVIPGPRSGTRNPERVD